MRLNWMLRDILREEAGNEGQGGGQGEGDKAPKTFNINGKEVDPATAAAALNLYNSLADPETGREIIEQLARRTGILGEDGKAPTVKEQKVLEGKFTKMMKTKLGKDYDKFSDALGPVFDEAMESMVADLKADLTGTSEASTWETVVDDFFESTRTTPELEAEMQRLIKRNGGRPAGLKGKAAKEYLQDFYELAAHKLDINLRTMRKTSSDDDDDSTRSGRRGIRDGADDGGDDRDNTPRRRSARRGDIPEFRETARPKGPLSIDDIVEAASKGIKFRN